VVLGGIDKQNIPLVSSSSILDPINDHVCAGM
jgi:hypothetical protein